MGANAQLEICGVWNAGLDASPPALPLGVVHLWQRRLDASTAEIDACYALLSADEREQAMRKRVERPRSDFILTRGTLRSLLAGYLKTSPHSLSFEYTSYGKPLLKDHRDFRFNVSHSDGLALLGFTRNREIGVDIEKVHPQTDTRQLAERFFSLREREDLRTLSGDELHAAFFRCWTRKEAYIKAKGQGLSLPLHQFDVSIAPNETKALLATRPDAAEAARWMICDISAPSGYAAALAVGEEAQDESPAKLKSLL
jgi:4'-phosphopantetheinyl transferase